MRVHNTSFDPTVRNGRHCPSTQPFKLCLPIINAIMPQLSYVFRYSTVFLYTDKGDNQQYFNWSNSGKLSPMDLMLK